jgi:thioredoxin 1
VDGVLVRFLIALGITGAGLSLYWLANRMILARVRKGTRGLESLRRGAPAILYFTTPSCAPCKTVQRPTIRKLQEMLGNRLQVIEVDASARPDLANYWGVLSVPTTFIIDSHGRPRCVNHGVAGWEKLLKQIESAEQAGASGGILRRLFGLVQN